MGVVGVTFSPLARALARRIGGGRIDEESAAEMQELRAEIAELRQELEAANARLRELDEITSRLEFAERMLAQVRARGALGTGAQT
jgi:uncharacterized protein involved in exopolysaccharide biosynthesis